MADSAAPGVHVREHGSVLARHEKRVLVWIATRLPDAVAPDHLSALSLASVALTGFGFAASRWTPWAAGIVVTGLVVNWFGDSLDGTVARVRGCERLRYGYYVDHVIDIAGTALLLTGLVCSPLTNPTVAVALLAAFLLASAEAYLATHAAGVFRLSFLGIGPTELRIVLALGAIQAARSPFITIAGTSFRLFDVAGAAGAAGLLAAFAVAAVRNARTLYREDGPDSSRTSTESRRALSLE